MGEDHGVQQRGQGRLLAAGGQGLVPEGGPDGRRLVGMDQFELRVRHGVSPAFRSMAAARASGSSPSRAIWYALSRIATDIIS